MLCSMNYVTIFRKKQIDTIPCSKVVANFKSCYKNKVTINSITKQTLINRHNIFPVSTITCPLMIKWQQNEPLFFRTQRQRRWTSHLLGGVSTCVLCIKTFSCVETIKDQHLFLHSLRNTVQYTLMRIAFFVYSNCFGLQTRLSFRPSIDFVPLVTFQIFKSNILVKNHFKDDKRGNYALFQY